MVGGSAPLVTVADSAAARELESSEAGTAAVEVSGGGGAAVNGAVAVVGTVVVVEVTTPTV